MDNNIKKMEHDLASFRELEDKNGESVVLNSLAKVYLDLDRYSEALGSSLNALEIAEAIDNKEQQCFAMNNIGLVHLILGNYKKAMEYFFSSLVLCREAGYKNIEAESFGYIGNAYLQMGNNEDALKYSQNSLQLCRELSIKQGEAEALFTIGEINATFGDDDKALLNFDDSLQLAEERGYKLIQTNILLAIGRTYFKQGDTDKALSFLTQSLAIAEEIQSQHSLAGIHQILAEVCKQQSQFDKALAHHEQFHAINTRLSDEKTKAFEGDLQTSEQLARVDTQTIYQLENVMLEQEIAVRKQTENRLNQRLMQIATVLQVYDEISYTLSVGHVLMMSLDASLRLSGAKGGFMALLDDDVLRMSSVVGNYQVAQNAILNSEAGIIKSVLNKRKAKLIIDYTFEMDDVPTLPDTQARMVIPLMSQEKLVGIINLETDKPERFDENIFQLMQVLEKYISVALDNANLYQQVQQHLAELQGLYDQVSQLEQLKTDMIRVAAHDLRSPLTAIYGYVQLLEARKDEFEERYVGYFAAMRQAAVRMRDMLDNILSLERIEQMANTETTERFDLAEQVRKAAEEYEVQASNKSQQFNITIEVDVVPIVQGDVNQVYEAISNIIGNAIKYTQESGSVNVTLQIESDRIRFEVQDNGYGIPDEAQKRLFQPFYRAKTKETIDIDGTGLGLHLVKNIIERHGGEMLFQSVYGKGSSFGFALPLTV